MNREDLFRKAMAINAIQKERRKQLLLNPHIEIEKMKKENKKKLNII